MTMKILGIETSCDETSVAILDNETIVAGEVFSQDIHARFGGVVPELASRAHMMKIDALAASVFDKTGFSCADMDLVAVTDSPGLAGALLVGISFGLGLHSQTGVPVTGVNHLEGHIYSLFCGRNDVAYPFLALLVSGGHTAIYRVDDFGAYACLGQTVDDAAGEAFDKVGKILGFPYPAGRAMEQEAAAATGDDGLRFPVAKVSASTLDFSFSGLKTAVKYLCVEKGSEWVAGNRPTICRAFQKTVIDSLVKNLALAGDTTGIRAVAVAGGVACNGALRKAVSNRFGASALFPAPSLCTDNAAMIARAGYERMKRNSLRFPRMSPSAGL
jgi:N6-L-threonylcarbamoyladenine synthase